VNVNSTVRDTVALAVVGIVLVALALGGHTKDAQTESRSSTYDDGPNGYRALYRVLETAHVPVRRLRRSLTTMTPGGTLVLSDDSGDPARIPLDRSDRAALSRFVAGGGRLVVLSDDFDGMRDIVPHVPQISAADVDIATASDALQNAAGVGTVDAPAESAFVRSGGATPLLVSSGGDRVAIAYRVGKGSVIAVTSPDAFGNERLAKRDNVRFAYAVLAGHQPVVFDEYAHGYNDDATFWQAIPIEIRWALGATIVIVLVGLIGANVPFAPPVPLDAPDERTSAAYVDAMASLLRRARARADALSSLARNVRRASRSTQRDGAVRELDELLASTPSDAVLRRAAWLEFQLRKDRI
jgi:Domain of unknown function (DUF4350)